MHSTRFPHVPHHGHSGHWHWHWYRHWQVGVKRSTDAIDMKFLNNDMTLKVDLTGRGESPEEQVIVSELPTVKKKLYCYCITYFPIYRLRPCLQTPAHSISVLQDLTRGCFP
jgi:hypothetical protein